MHLYTKRELVEVLILIFKKYNLIYALKTDEETLRTLFIEVAIRYRRGPYHHFTHAVCLVHLCQWILEQIDFEFYFTPLDAACMMLAAIAHDVGHPSVNNAYSIRAKQKVAILYNDKSVLENFHLSLFF
jgi:hypothetical protein